MTVSGSSGHTFKAAFENVRQNSEEISFASMIQHSIDVLKNETLSAVEEISSSINADSDEYLANTEIPDGVCDDNLTPMEPVVGDRVKRFWHDDNRYNSRQITEFSDVKHQITHNDGDIENLNISQKTGVFAFQQLINVPFNRNAPLGSIAMNKKIYKEKLSHLGNKVFLWHRPRVFPGYVFQKTYITEEGSFRCTVRAVT